MKTLAERVCLVLEMRNVDYDLMSKKEQEETLPKMLSEIYRFCHLITAPTCCNGEERLANFLALEARMIAAKIIPDWRDLEPELPERPATKNGLLDFSE